MSDQHIVAALQMRLKAFAQAKGLRVAYEGVPFTPQSEETYLADHHLPANPFNPDIAVRRTRNIGIYQVNVSAPANANPVEVRALADALRAHFPRLLTVSSAGVAVQVDGPPSRGPLIPGAGRVSIPVSVPYRADVVNRPP